MTYRTAAAQLGKIASKVLVAVEEAAHCVDWWAEAKVNLTDMKISVPIGLKIKLDHEQVDEWKTIRDKFTLYIYNVSYFSLSVTRDYTHLKFHRTPHMLLGTILVPAPCQ